MTAGGSHEARDRLLAGVQLMTRRLDVLRERIDHVVVDAKRADRPDNVRGDVLVELERTVDDANEVVVDLRDDVERLLGDVRSTVRRAVGDLTRR